MFPRDSMSQWVTSWWLVKRTWGEQSTAWPPLYSHPSQAAASTARARLGALSVVISQVPSRWPSADMLSQQWSSDTCGPNGSNSLLALLLS